MGRAIALWIVAALVAGCAASRTGYWTFYRIDSVDERETSNVLETVSTLASQWGLKEIQPVPSSAVEEAFVRGASGFAGTFYMTADVRPGVVVLELALDPASDTDFRHYEALNVQLAEALRRTYGERVVRRVATKSLSDGPVQSTNGR